jgi:ABC-type polysaccharide/polyol phosphate transport system ATPase subunit
MTELVEGARTMFLVSHALATVRTMCNDAIWLNAGRLVLRGDPTEVVAAYQKYVEVGDEAMALEDL